MFGVEEIRTWHGNGCIMMARCLKKIRVDEVTR